MFSTFSHGGALMARQITATFQGRLGRDPELKNDKGMVVFTVAVNNRQRNRETGEVDEGPRWIDVAAWGQPAQFALDHLRKGSLAYLSGTLDQRRWTGSDGVQVRDQLRANQIDFAGDRPKQDTAPRWEREAPRQGGQAKGGGGGAQAVKPGGYDTKDAEWF